MANEDLQRKAAEKRLWHTANLQGLVLSNLKENRPLETLATFHNISLIEVELASSALGLPVEDGQLEISNPLRGLRTKDRIIDHPVITVLKKDYQILEQAGAPDETLRKVQTTIDLLRTAYMKNNKASPFDANAAQKAWTDALKVPNAKGHPNEILFEAAKKRDIIPNFRPILTTTEKYQDIPSDALWTKLAEAKRNATDKEAELTTFLETGYQDLEKVAVKPLITETLAWYKTVSELSFAEEKKVLEGLQEINRYAQTLANLERDTLTHNVNTALCQIMGPKAVDELVKNGGEAFKKFYEQAKKFALKKGKEFIGVDDDTLELADMTVTLTAILLNKGREYEYFKELTEKFVDDKAKQLFEKVIQENWDGSRLKTHVNESNQKAAAAFREAQVKINGTYLEAVMENLSPAGQKTAQLMAEMSLVMSSTEGRVATEGENFRAAGGKNTDLPELRANQLSVNYSRWLFAQNPMLVMLGSEENLKNPIDDIKADLEEAGYRFENETELTNRSFRYREIKESRELMKFVLQDQETAKSYLGGRVLNWIQERENAKDHFDPYRPGMAFRRSGVDAIYREAATGAETPEIRRQEIYVLQAIAASLAVDPKNGYAVLKEPADNTKDFIRAVERLPDTKAREFIERPYRQTFENLAAEINGQPVIELLAKKGELGLLNEHWIKSPDFLAQTTSGGDRLIKRILFSGNEKIIDRLLNDTDLGWAGSGTWGLDFVNTNTGKTGWHELAERPGLFQRLQNDIGHWPVAELMVRDPEGRTFLDIAQENGIDELIPEAIRTEISARCEGLDRYEEITAAIHRKIQGESKPEDEHFFDGDQLRPEIEILATQDFDTPQHASAIDEMLTTATALKKIQFERPLEVMQDQEI